MEFNTYQGPGQPNIDDTLPLVEDNPDTNSDDLISLAINSSSNPVSPVFAKDKAWKVNLGMPFYNKSFDDVYEDLTTGNEDGLRTEMADQSDFEQSQRRANLVRYLANKTQDSLPLDLVNKISDLKTQDPKSVIEEYFGKAYSNQLKTSAESMEDTIWDDIDRNNPQMSRATGAVIDTVQSRREIVTSLLQETQQLIANRSTLGTVADLATSIIPFYNDFKLRGQSGDTSIFSGIGLGENLQKQVDELYSIPSLTQFKQKLSSIVDNLNSSDPDLGAKFLSYMLGQSNSQTFLDNFSNLIDAASIPGTGLVAKGVKSLVLGKEAKDVAKTVLEAAGKTSEVNPEHMAEAVGDLHTAAIKEVASNVSKSLTSSAPDNSIRQTIRQLPRFLRTYAEQLAGDPGNHRELANQLSEQAIMRGDQIVKTISDLTRVERIPGALASEKTMAALRENTVMQYPGINNSILDMNISKNPFSNTYTVSYDIGKPGAELFRTKEQATTFAKVQQLDSFEVKPQGLGFFIRMKKPLNETQSIIRDGLLSTKDAITPSSKLSTFLNYITPGLRTSEETLSAYQRYNRKTATYGSSKLLALGEEMAKDIKDFSRSFIGTDKRKRWYDWKRVVESGRDMIDPDTQQKGYFFKGIGELEAYYRQTFNRPPGEDEIKAYFAYKNINEYDGILRELAILRNKERVGTQSHTVTMTLNGERVTSPEFDGVLRNKFSGGTGVILYIDEIGRQHLLTSGKISTQAMKKYKNMLAEGQLKLIELFDPDSRPLQGFGDKVANNRIKYVLTSNVDSKALDLAKQLPRRGGGHIEYDYSHYIKQAKVIPERYGTSVIHRYEGDTTIMPISVKALGEDVAGKLDKFRQLLKAKDIEGAKKYLKDSGLPMTYKEVKQWFSPKKIEGVLHPPMLNMEEPIRVVPRGASIGDLDDTMAKKYEGTFENATRGGSLARQYQVEFTGERDADLVRTVNNVGTKNNPIYTFEPAQYVDPISTMQRAVGRIINSTFMDDYKIFSVEHWIKEASKYLDVKDGEVGLRSSPFYHFMNPKFLSQAPTEEVGKLKTANFQIRQLLGMKTNVDVALDDVAQKLADSIYSKTGSSKLALKAEGIFDKGHDLIAKLRSAVYDAKLGLFSPAQLITQLQTYSTILAISPRHAPIGAFAGMLTQFARKSPELLGRLDSIASKLTLPGMPRFKPGEFKEAYEELQKTGLHLVGGEYVLLDDMLSPKLIRRAGGSFLDAGRIFFKEGERMVRYGAWYTAYLEYRAANPFGRITNIARQEILDRADMYTVNMTRASASLMNKGILSIPMQFLTYQLRAMELFTGKRLSIAEKARMFGVYSVLYGVPTAMGVAGYPFGDMFRKYAIDNGYVVGDNFISSTLMEGLPALMLALVTSNDKNDLRSGTWYNLGDRWGVQGFQWLRDFIRSDEPWYDILGGAVYGTLKNTITNSEPFMKSAMAALYGGQDQFPLTVDDVVSVFKEISSVNTAWRSWLALSTTNWYSKNGNLLDTDLSKMQVVFQALTGLQDQRIVDANYKRELLKDRKNMYEEIEKRFTQEIRAALRVGSTDPESARKHFTKATSLLATSEYPEELKGKLMSRSLKGYESLVDSLSDSFYTKNVPENEKEDKWNAYRKELNIRDIRRGVQ